MTDEQAEGKEEALPEAPLWPDGQDNPRSPRRWRIGAIAIAVVVALAVIGGVLIAVVPHGSTSSKSGVTPSASPTPGTSAAQKLYRQALTAVRAQAGFHYVSTSTEQVTIGDAGKAGGRQLITVTTSYGVERFTLILLNGTVYFQGNQPALEDQLGIPATTAATDDGTWISVLAADGPYQTLAAGIDISDQITEMALRPTATSKVTDNGTTATRITGSVPPQFNAPGGTGYLDVSPKTHLPLSYVSTISETGISSTDTVTFSAWGTAPAVTAPPGSTPWSALGAVAPPGGFGNGGSGASSTPIAA